MSDSVVDPDLTTTWPGIHLCLLHKTPHSDMESTEDNVDGRDMNHDRSDLLDRDDSTATKKIEILNAPQDSDVGIESTPQTAIQRKKRAYSCSRCGEPLKGHTCNASRIQLPTFYVAAHRKRKRTTKRRFHIEGVTDEQQGTAKETNYGEIRQENVEKPKADTANDEAIHFHAQHFGEMDELLTDTEKESKVDQSRNWYDDEDDDEDGDLDDQRAIKKRPTPKKWVRRLDSSSEDDDHDRDTNDAALIRPPASAKRVYTCRMCGVPRKGHICPFVGGASTKGRLPQLHSPHSPTPRTHTRRRPNQNPRKLGNSRFDHVSVMERTGYNSSSDSNDDDDDDNEDVQGIPATDILIPAHIFMDEVHTYIMEHLQHRQPDETSQMPPKTKRETELEKQSLQSWARNVATTFETLNERAYHELQRISQQKEMEQRITKERDAILTLRNKIKCLQRDNRNITDHIVSLRQEHDRNMAASQFLSAIDAIRNNK